MPKASPQKQETSAPSQASNKPAKEFRRGRIRATVWRNNHEKMGVWYSVTLTRSYKDEGGQWKSATSFGRDDMLSVGEVCRQAWHWIWEETQSQPSGAASAGVEEEAPADVPF
jgi:hypothetical protein